MDKLNSPVTGKNGEQSRETRTLKQVQQLHPVPPIAFTLGKGEKPQGDDYDIETAIKGNTWIPSFFYRVGARTQHKCAELLSLKVTASPTEQNHQGALLR